MQNKGIIICCLILLFSISCKKNIQSSNHKKETTDTIFICMDTIRMLNFGDYFSKIEIIPLPEFYDEMVSPERSDPISVDNDLFMFITSNEMIIPVNGTKREDTLFFYSGNKYNILKSITIPYINNYITSYYPVFSTFDNHFYIHTGLSNELYRVDAEKPSLFLDAITDYGEKTITPEIMENRSEIPYYQMLEGGHYASTVNIYQNNKYYLVETWYLQHTFLTFYDKQSRQTATGVDQFSNGIIISDSDYIFPDIQSMTDEALCLMVRDLRINSVIDNHYLTEESKKRLQEINKLNRAVIIKYFFK